MKYLLSLIFVLSGIVAAHSFGKEASLAPITSMEVFEAKIKQMAEQEKSFIPDSIRKEQECIDLVNRGATHLEKTDLKTACYDFVYANEWRRGEIFNILLDEEGHILCHGDTNSLIWRDIKSTLSFYDESIRNTIKNIDPNGQWVHYKWNNGFKFVYMKKLIINDVIYYIGAGFFPHDKKYIAEQLVKTAIAYFKQVPSNIAFIRISSVSDAFVLGDVSVYVGDFLGNILSSSMDSAFSGQNLINLQDIKGTYVIKNTINHLKKENKPFWYDAYWLGEFQKNYAESVYDKRDNKNYFFVGNYRPNIDQVAAIDLLVKGEEYIKKVGPKEAFLEFSNPTSSFNKGGISLFAYDFNGMSLADGEYPLLVGQNLLNRRDAQGKMLVRDIIDIAKKTGEGILLTYDKNSFKKIFIKVIDTPDGQIILGTGIYDQSKKISVESIVENGLRFLNKHTLVEALDAFSNNQGSYYLGDIYLFMITSNGMVLLDGEHKNIAWKDFDKIKINDPEIVKKMIEVAKKGGGWLKYNFRNAENRVLIRPVTIKNFAGKNEMAILGAGYFL